ncbi:MAG: tetratricopeptide repeat protein [Pseudomonadota bacterium]
MSPTRRGSGPTGGAVSPDAGSRGPMTRLVALPARQPEGTVGSQERVAGLAKRVLPPAGLDADALAGVWRRLNQAERRDRRAAVRPLAWAFGVALSVAVSGGVVAAATGAWSWPRAAVQRAVRLWRPTAQVSNPLSGSPTGARAGAAGPIVENAIAPAPPALAPVGQPLPSGAGPARVTKRPSARLALAAGIGDAVAAAPPSSLAAESELLLRALHRLRRERDPAGCLRELDRYAIQFPSGDLRHEAERTRIDALLMAGRRADARAALSRVTLTDGARDRELLLIRGELSAEVACPPAIADYERVLAAADIPPALAARALWGRAVCRSRLGDESGARADLATYLARYPDASHAAAARQRLAR